ncbi:GrpB family protein [Microbacterium algeriense]|uniref:GrpB family protein n=1 Tax=Microbacterium algeriense TaxID=2615184 RepID=A0ABQ6V897_9MICO|nr:GrpB family protein [Microbacterium algeriense]KAB1866501.1 GrpB family protein [Microbacterium algeriense]
MTVALVPYDPAWPSLFQQTVVELRAHGNPGWVIEHIGSTAIRGMSAKPVIDVAVRIADDSDFAAHRAGLEAAGWRVGSAVRAHRVMIFVEDGERTRIAHFFETASWDRVNQRILRDWLRTHPEDAELYERAKHAAAMAAQRGTASYNDGKTVTIQAIIDRARAERGLPPVPVSDKR